MNPNALKVVALLKSRFPLQTSFKRKHIHQASLDLSLKVKDYLDIISDEFKVH